MPNRVLYLAYSAATTASYNNARIAAEGRDYVTSVDTKFASAGQAAIVISMARLLEQHPEWDIDAAAMLAEDYPDRKIRVVDSTLATGLQGLLLPELAGFRKRGHSLEETYERGEEIKKTASDHPLRQRGTASGGDRIYRKSVVAEKYAELIKRKQKSNIMQIMR